MELEKKGPQRTCIACRTGLDKDHLIRYVMAPDGTLLVDYRHRLPGRGSYTCIAAECIRKACEKKAFLRAYRGRCQPPTYDDLLSQACAAVEQRVANLLGMGRKAGLTVSGSNMVMDQLRKTECGLGVVIVAADISADIGTKIAGLSTRQGIQCIRLFNKAKIGQMLGKEERSVVALSSGALVDTLLTELSRYRQLAREN